MDIEFYVRARGDSPVENFISNLENKEKKKIIKAVERLEREGLSQLLKTQDAKKFKGHDDIYELITYRHRISFTKINEKYWLLHGFKKQSNDTKPREIKKAEDLKNELILRIKNKAPL